MRQRGFIISIRSYPCCHLFFGKITVITKSGIAVSGLGVLGLGLRVDKGLRRGLRDGAGNK